LEDATILAATGNSPAITSKILGHASVAFTLQTYTHPDEEELDRAAAAFERALGARSPPFAKCGPAILETKSDPTSVLVSWYAPRDSNPEPAD
jgi:hypothetical protein